MKTKQDEDEPSLECTKKFKQAQDNVKSIMGTEWLDEFMENMEECIKELTMTQGWNSRNTATNHSWHVNFLKQ